MILYKVHVVIKYIHYFIISYSFEVKRNFMIAVVVKDALYYKDPIRIFKV